MTKWRKSSHSASSGDDGCVELARLPLAIGLRDSKAPQTGYLTLSSASLATLLARVKQGDLNL